MFFTRTRRYVSGLTPDELKNKINGKHLVIHNLDFEVIDKVEYLRVVPHAEDVEEIKTLPFTYIEFKKNEDKTEVTIRSKMRKFDMGGPMILLSFCLMFLAGSVIVYFVDYPANTLSYTLLAISIVTLIIFWVRMEMGYFDYIRKIRTYLVKQLEIK